MYPIAPQPRISVKILGEPAKTDPQNAKTKQSAATSLNRLLKENWGFSTGIDGSYASA